MVKNDYGLDISAVPFGFFHPADISSAEEFSG